MRQPHPSPLLFLTYPIRVTISKLKGRDIHLKFSTVSTKVKGGTKGGHEMKGTISRPITVMTALP